MGPRVSVVIPTRNRPTLARVGAELALAAVGADGEVVVADNGDAPLDLGIEDPRLTVLARPDHVLGMTENWERALRAARGEWLLFLSDKCRLVPGAIDALLASAGAEKLVTFLKLPFRQEVPPEQLADPTALRAAPGEASWPARQRRLVAVRDSLTALREWYSSLFYCQYLPMLYNSLVHRSLVDEAVGKYGRFFVGSSPDVGSSLVLLALTRRYVETTVPAVAIEFPTHQLAEWSTGVAWFTAHPSREKLVTDYGKSFFADFQLPVTATGGMAHTLLEFKRSRPELAAQVIFDWQRFALVAAWEIEGMKSAGKWALHWQVLRAAQQDGLNPLAVAQQARALMMSRAPRSYELLRRLRGSRPENGSSAWSTEKHASLDEFIATLTVECGAFLEPARIDSRRGRSTTASKR